MPRTLVRGGPCVSLRRSTDRRRAPTGEYRDTRSMLLPLKTAVTSKTILSPQGATGLPASRGGDHSQDPQGGLRHALDRHRRSRPRCCLPRFRRLTPRHPGTSLVVSSTSDTTSRSLHTLPTGLRSIRPPWGNPHGSANLHTHTTGLGQPAPPPGPGHLASSNDLAPARYAVDAPRDDANDGSRGSHESWS